MDSNKYTRIWNHVLFTITGLVGAISAFISDQFPAFDSFYAINILISMAYVLWGTVGWNQTRTRDETLSYWIYFLGQGVFIFSNFLLTIFSYQEPQISLFVLPVIYQMARISFVGLRFAWWVFLLVITTTNFLIPERQTVTVIQYFLFQTFFIGAFLAAGRIVKRQIDQQNQIEKMAQDLDAGNRQLTQHVNEIEKIHADEIRRYQALDSMRKQLLDSTTHDIRNPLGIILSYAHLVETKGEEYKDAHLKEYATGIYETVDRIKSLLVGLLDYTQLETRQAIKKETVFINGYLERIVQDLQVVANESKIKLLLSLPPFDFDLKLDPVQMYRVFENLISNSIKFTPDGGSIEISIVADDQNIAICVKDTGIGIPEEAIEHIFKPFYRIKSKERQDSEGAGLGLAIANSIVKHHKGEIQVESKVGVGSTFKIILPL